MIAIVGPTAVGKTELALQIAGCFEAEIIGADSRQVYRYMDIGTGKPSSAERAAVPHHLIDIVDPDEEFSLARYHSLAIEVLNTIRRKGKLPLLVGGSGLYVWSLVEGWRIPEVPPDRDLRRRFEVRAEQEGSQSLYRELRSIDPLAAERIDEGNIRRIIRALEIHHVTGQPPSQLQRKDGLDFPVLIIGLTRERGQLYERTDRRIDHMIEAGLVGEVDRLLGKGYGPDLPSMSGIGYRQITQFRGGGMTLPEAVDRIKHETHRLVRRQYAWFRLSDSRIHWYHADGEEGDRDRSCMATILDSVKGLIEAFVRCSLEGCRPAVGG